MDYFGELVQHLLRQLSIDSVQSDPCADSPFGAGVGACIRDVLDCARAWGFDTKNEQGYYGVCEIGDGEAFGILGHLDTVPYDDEGWSANPLGELRDGVVYGRGVLDDKGPMLCCLYAVKQLIDEGRRPSKRIRMIWGGNEESGWKCIERFMQTDTMPPQGFSPDGDFPAIYCEKGLVHYRIRLPLPTGLIDLQGGSRGNVVMPSCIAVCDGALHARCDDPQLRVTVTAGKTYLQAAGTPAHASTPAQGDNALWHILRYLSDAIGGDYARLFDALCCNDGSGLGIRLQDKQSGALTCNVGVARVADAALELILDVRHPVTYDKQDVARRIADALGGCDVEIVHYHDPLYVDPDHPLLRRLLAAYESVTGQHAAPIAIGGGTYARALPVGVAFGPIFPDMPSTIHQKDERVSLRDLRKMYDIYYAAIRDLCFE